MTIKIEGSDFVLQVTKAVASDFERRTSDVETTVEFSYGIQGFIAGESDIANASAPMSGEEIATAVDNGVDYLELPVAKSVITIMVNERNDFVECLTFDQLANVWKPDSVVDSWNDLDDNWPDRPINLYTLLDRGVRESLARVLFDGEFLRSSGQSFAKVEWLLSHVEDNLNALGYADYSYYLENSNDVELVGIDFGQGCVKPTKDTIRDGSYDLSIGPMFIYVSKSSLVTPLKREFAEFYMEHTPEIAHEVGYVALNPQVYQRNLILLMGCIPSASPQTEDVDLEGIGLPNCSDLPLEAPPPVDTGLHPGLKNDREVLLNMAGTLAGESTLNWSDHRRIREWEGLSFSGSPIRVTALELPQRGLTGNIPAELGGLTHLRGLHLGNNELTGNIPPELGKLGRLQSLVLPSNKLTGALPPELNQLTSLFNLDLTSNELEGAIPDLAQLTEFRSLNLSDNKLTGNIPPWLGGLNKLARLYLANNDLTGSIPPDLVDLGYLQYLFLSGNELTGCIPPELWALDSHDLRNLGLQNCQ